MKKTTTKQGKPETPQEAYIVIFAEYTEDDLHEPILIGVTRVKAHKTPQEAHKDLQEELTEYREQGCTLKSTIDGWQVFDKHEQPRCAYTVQRITF